MENLIIEHRNQLLSKKAIGGLWIFLGIIFLIIGKDSLDRGDWMRSIAFCLIGLIYFTPLVGSNKSQIEICEGCLKIIWINWIRKVTVLDSEIESIVLAENGVLIKRKGKKTLKIKLYLIDKDQKNQVFDFFTKYAQQKNLVQE
jgi:uncharacterized membrane protein YobD (UPF0266 family)